MNRKHLISPWLVTLIGMGLIGATLTLMAEDTVFSGPQPGESTTPFQSVYIIGEQAGQERDLIEENKGAPTTIVFIHALERSIVPLMKAVDGYGAKFPDKLKTEFVFLAEEKNHRHATLFSSIGIAPSKRKIVTLCRWHRRPGELRTE